MRYISTRGAAPTLGFADALLAGLARDGGLYLPVSLPQWPPDAIRALRGLPYAEAAVRVMTPFVGGDFGPAEIEALTAAAYAGFRHAATAPIAQIDDNLFALELFHGPTLAFKDFAMQWLGQAMNRVLRQRGARATIIGATSGDTGAAAIEAFGGQSQVEVFILYPRGRVSDVQRRQMTTVGKPNVHALAIEGAFDDCQRIVKELFGDLAFRDEMRLSGVNSINWARILAQIVYYFVGAVALGAPERAVSFAVPTGNFGDVLAGYYAKRIGLPVDRLVIATNENDILVRALASGHYAPKGVKATQSPSMDIQVSSNFERLLFEASGRNPDALVALMSELASDGAFAIRSDTLTRIRADFDAFRVDETACAEEMGRVYRESGMVIDPHSAVGVHAGRKALAAAPATPVIALGTAHPAKFPDAVERATGVRPTLPEPLSDLMDRRETIVGLPNDRRAVADYGAADCASRGVERSRQPVFPGARRRSPRRPRHLKTAAIGVFVAAGSQFERAGEHGLSHSSNNGVRGHAAAKRPRHRRGDRERRRRPQCGDRGRADQLFRPRFRDDAGLALDMIGDILTESVFDARRARTGEERHRSGDRRRRGYARRLGVRSPHRDRVAGPADRAADPRHAGGRRRLRPGRDRPLSRSALQRRRDRGRRRGRGRTRSHRRYRSIPARKAASRVHAGRSAGRLSRRRDQLSRRLEQTHVVVGFEGRPAGRRSRRRPGVRRRGGRRHVVATLPGSAGETRPRLFDLRLPLGFLDAGLFGFYAGSADRDAARGGGRLARLPR